MIKKQKDILTWEDLQNFTKEHFTIWFDHSQLEWGEKAWGILSKYKLANYNGELELTKVYLRLLALMTIYYDFCQIAWGESKYDQRYYREWAEGLKIKEFRIGQLIGELNFDLKEDETIIIPALSKLIRYYRKEVSMVFEKHFKGHQELFQFFWQSINTKDGNHDVKKIKINDKETSNNEQLTSSRMFAYSWISDGCPQLKYRLREPITVRLLRHEPMEVAGLGS